MAKVFVLMDGLGDRSCPQLGGLTPLQYAKTPALDSIAEEGQNGYVSIINSQTAPESDVAVISLLGYDPTQYYPGRGPLETFGTGISLHDGDLAMRANFATMMSHKLIDRRVGRSLHTSEAQKLAVTLNKSLSLGHPFLFYPTVQHRGVLIVRGFFSPHISNVDPGYERRKGFGVVKQNASLKLEQCRPLDITPEAKESAAVINTFVKESYRVLKDHPINIRRHKKMQLPANIVLLRDAGVGSPNFNDKRTGWAAIVSMPLEKGIARATGMDVLSIPIPPLKTTNIKKHLIACLDAEIAAAKKHLKKSAYSHYYIHFKETDIPGHDGDAQFKAVLLERLDKKFFRFLAKRDDKLVITGDHATPCTLKSHSADPVPVVYRGGTPDTVLRFDEVACRQGSLGKVYGKDLLRKVRYI